MPILSNHARRRGVTPHVKTIPHHVTRCCRKELIANQAKAVRPRPRRKGTTLSELTDPVRRFIADNINSVAQLEVLLLLRQDPQRAWNAEDVARSLYSGQTLIAAHLADWESRGFFAAAPDQPGCFRYAPASPELDALADGLAEAYKVRRVSVITAIYSRPVDKVRTFADAFRLRKGEQK